MKRRAIHWSIEKAEAAPTPAPDPTHPADMVVKQAARRDRSVPPAEPKRPPRKNCARRGPGRRPLLPGKRRRPLNGGCHRPTWPRKSPMSGLIGFPGGAAVPHRPASSTRKQVMVFLMPTVHDPGYQRAGVATDSSWCYVPDHDNLAPWEEDPVAGHHDARAIRTFRKDSNAVAEAGSFDLAFDMEPIIVETLEGFRRSWLRVQGGGQVSGVTERSRVRSRHPESKKTRSKPQVEDRPQQECRCGPRPAGDAR